MRHLTVLFVARIGFICEAESWKPAFFLLSAKRSAIAR